ncbi:antirepressor regulating drug resistance protein [Novosphingobium sp. FGD1]|jgi:bla regulator protein BlaR1|uniref:Antirepressor regulating drug resistance protein n=1 Tax=Novosphingobium silvae TaxID=2692619 RepID=A0A7X4GIU8_9SPHN|nr:M56 family metallopeptidase [Novosphingobium silvae]MYL99046.1 antirepressor regulating drug resistance protein [Novosphingobium silvae]
MIEWLTDTLFVTGALMALVLVARRPVARWFGPGAAYALWALPMIRLVLPPLALPRGLLPQVDLGPDPLGILASGDATAPTAAYTDAVPLTVEAAAALSPFEAAGALPGSATMEPGFIEQVPWTTLALSLWLGGAVLFLLWRTVTYRWMRRDLLEGARLVARSSTVRIVESPAINAPLAFGVRDKVIALPRGFLANEDSETSDFAIAHEMEHHAGGDLLALIAMQPLFALHWFNPVAWAGWRALRQDQEAACDARVMAGRSRAERARYGELIASLAGGTRLGLAAPMAGPLSGDKPIIHRLKSLARKDVSPARRVLARSLFALAIVTVPATATASYAALDEAEAPEPTAPTAAPEVLTEAEIPAVPQALPRPEARIVPESAHNDAWQAPAAAAVPAPAAVSEPATPPAPPAPSVAATLERVALRESQAAAQDAEHRAAQAHWRAAEAQDRASEAQRRAAAARLRADAALARAPRVEQTVSADGNRRTISIVRREGAGGGVVEQRMVLDADCPADAHRHEMRSGRDGANSITVICTGTPRAAREAVREAARSARASIAADRALNAQVRAQVLSSLNHEMHEATAEAGGI